MLIHIINWLCQKLSQCLDSQNLRKEVKVSLILLSSFIEFDLILNKRMLFFPNGFLSFPIICVYKTSVAIQPAFWNISASFWNFFKNHKCDFYKIKAYSKSRKKPTNGHVNIKTVIEFKGKIRCYGTFFCYKLQAWGWNNQLLSSGFNAVWTYRSFWVWPHSSSVLFEVRYVEV